MLAYRLLNIMQSISEAKLNISLHVPGWLEGLLKFFKLNDLNVKRSVIGALDRRTKIWNRMYIRVISQFLFLYRVWRFKIWNYNIPSQPPYKSLITSQIKMLAYHNTQLSMLTKHVSSTFWNEHKVCIAYHGNYRHIA